MQLGQPLPTPQNNFVFDKMMNYLKQAGVDVEKEGDQISLMPLIDKKVKKMSNGEVTDPGAMLIAKNLKNRPGGIFDPEIFGGLEGKK